MLAEEPADAVTFLFGELAVCHVSNPFLPDEETDSIAGSPPLAYWLPQSLCMSSPAAGLRRQYADRSASQTKSVFILSLIDQPTIRRLARSITQAK